MKIENPKIDASMIPTVTFLAFCLLFCSFVVWLHKSNDPLIEYKVGVSQKRNLKFRHVGIAQFGHCIYRFTLKFAHSEDKVILRDQTAIIPFFYVYYEIPMNRFKNSDRPGWDYVLISSKAPKKTYCRIAQDIINP